jgi:transposase
MYVLGVIGAMAERGRSKVPLVLTDEERETLARWSRRAKSSQALAVRCRIVLACAEGKTNKTVAAELGIWPQTVTKWRARLVAQRLEGLGDEPRPGAPRRIADERVEAVVVATLQETAKDATHWSRASMAKRSGLSTSTVGRIWKAFRLKPHLADTCNLSADPLFVEKVRDVVGAVPAPTRACPGVVCG